MRVTSVLIAAAIATFATAGAAAPSARDRLRQQAQTLCSDDAMKLCGDVVADDAKAAACMKAHLAQVSPECRKAMRAMERR